MDQIKIFQTFELPQNENYLPLNGVRKRIFTDCLTDIYHRSVTFLGNMGRVLRASARCYDTFRRALKALHYL